ncbi:MAG: coenzyme F420-0:L-glutamate ligase [Methanosarcinales archaeon]|nr:coenzyme F420-0:L-glutamate ligase [Methanosarcinales archaeon]
MQDRLELIGIKTPLIRAGDDFGVVLINAIREKGITLKDGDIIVLAESAVATSEGRLVDLREVNPGPEAEELGEKYSVDSREMELILSECDEIIGGVPGAVLTITNGNMSPNAGIDGSNAPEDHVVLLPENPGASAERIRKQLQETFQCKVGVIVGDSRTQPMRLGCVGIALGCAGILPVEDARGSKDLFGKELTITSKAIADNMVSAAQLIMGEAGEGIPSVVIRGNDVIVVDNDVKIPVFSKEECMYYSNISR